MRFTTKSLGNEKNLENKQSNERSSQVISDTLNRPKIAGDSNS